MSEQPRERSIDLDQRQAGGEPDGVKPVSRGRRRFLFLAGAGGAALALGGVWGWKKGSRVAHAQQNPSYPGKEGLHVHNLRPLNIEAPPHLLDDEITPISRHFVRNNGLIPDVDPSAYRLTVDGEVEHELSLSYHELTHNFEIITQPALIECGGNGRASFDPPVRGSQWNRGAIGCAVWTGVRLRDILEAAGLKSAAVYLGNYGLDESLNPQRVERFSRGIPIDKALEPHTMVAFRMNGKPLPREHGFPVRLVVPGWIGSASQKWLSRIWVRDRVHDSAKMTGSSYRVPAYPVAPGAKVPKEDMVIATAWHIKSVITAPQQGAAIASGQPLEIRGNAWAGEDIVKRVELSFDHGRHWWVVNRMTQKSAKYAWHRWRFSWTPPKPGYYEVWARAWDQNGNTQPPIQPWNPKGYLGNAIHRVPLQVS